MVLLTMDPMAFALVIAAGQLGAGLAVVAAMMTAVGQGNIGAKAIESIARQPEARGSIMTTMFISLAVSETGGIYGLLIAIILLFANPLVGQYVRMFAG